METVPSHTRPRRGQFALLVVIDVAAACLVFALVDGLGAGVAAPAAALIVALATGLAILVIGRPRPAPLPSAAARLPLSAAGRALAAERSAWPPAAAAEVAPVQASPPVAPASAPAASVIAAETARQLLVNFAGFSAVIREHATTVISGTEQAAVDFIQQLNAIDQAVKALTSFILDAQTSFRQIDTTTHDTTSRNAALLAELDATLAETRRSLAVIVNERQALADVVDTARTLADKSAMIAGIARTTKMLSINANIEAARAGGEGSGFGVIAKEIRELSMHTDKTTREMATLIETSLVGLEQFLANSKRLETELEDVSTVIDRMAGHLRTVAGVYGQMQDYIGDVTGRVDVHGREIEQSLVQTFAKVQFQDIVRQQLEGIIHGLDQFRAVVDEDHGPDLTAAEQDARRITGLGLLIDRLREGYVMQQQCDAHARATGGGEQLATAGGPAIELF